MAAQSLHLKTEQRLLVSGGMGAMGFSLPAALGAAMALPGSRVISIAGDGGIQVNIQELEVIAFHRIPVKIIVLNNRCLGMVRQFQDQYFGGRRQSTVIGYSCPDLKRVAEAYGLPVFAIHRTDEISQVLDEALRVDGPAFIHVVLDLNTGVSPKLMVNCPIEDMSPQLDRAELVSNMLINLLSEEER